MTLRAETGAPLLDCRAALEEAHGDLARAREFLVQRGKVLAGEKAGRTAGQGTIGVYVHHDGRAAALVLLRCETDFVAENPVFRSLASELAMHVVAMRPTVVRPEETPAGSEPAQAALLAQPFIQDPSGKSTVGDRIAAKVLELGENIVVEKFIRFSF